MKNNVLNTIFFSNSNLRWGWIITFYLLIVITTISIIVGPLVFILSLINYTPQPGKPVTGWSSIIGSIITLLAGYSAFIIGTHIAQRLLRKSNLSRLGLSINKKWSYNLVLGIGLGTSIVIVSTFLSWLMGWYQFLGYSWQFRPTDILLPAFILSFIASLQSPILEEVIFRGFIFQTLLDRWGLRIAVFISSILFGLAHLTNVDSNYSWLAAVISTFLAGLMFAQAYLVYKSLWLPVGIHFGWIFSGRLLNDVGIPAEKALLIVSKVEGPSILVNPLGGGAGLFELIGVGLVSLILWKIFKLSKKMNNNKVL